jgi:hypothetical protein
MLRVFAVTAEHSSAESGGPDAGGPPESGDTFPAVYLYPPLGCVLVRSPPSVSRSSLIDGTAFPMGAAPTTARFGGLRARGAPTAARFGGLRARSAAPDPGLGTP